VGEVAHVQTIHDLSGQLRPVAILLQT
jgi:hypothetical protein